MTTLAQAYGTSTAFTLNATSWTSAHVISSDAVNLAGLSPIPDDVLITVDFTTSASAAAGQKGVNVYVAISEDGTHYSDNDQYSGTNNTQTALRSPTNFLGPFFISAATASITAYAVFALSMLIGRTMPRAFGLILENQTGQTVTSPAATYTPITWTNT